MTDNKPEIYLAILLVATFNVVVWSQNIESDPRCRISVYSRQKCSTLELSREACNSRGCCYDAKQTYGKCYRRTARPMLSFGSTTQVSPTPVTPSVATPGDDKILSAVALLRDSGVDPLLANSLLYSEFGGNNVIAQALLGRILGPNYYKLNLFNEYKQANSPGDTSSYVQHMGGEAGYLGSKVLTTCNPMQYETKCGNPSATRESCQRWNCCWDEVDNSCYHAVSNVLRLRPQCAPGFTNPPYCTDINECLSSPCVNGGICINQINSYQCQCPQPSVGVNCQAACDSKPCLNNGVCTNVLSSYTCSCMPGFNGNNCQTNIDDCAANPCVNGACTDGVNSYTCTCTAGWQGTNCDSNIDDCAANPCVNGACTDGVNSYTCTCTTGWQGTNCDSNIDDCAANPCVNGACTDGVNSYTCTCTAGWQGTNCDQDINECSATNNCAVCQNLVPSYFCVCEISSYEGILCTWAVIGTTTYRVPATTTTTSRIAAIAICAGLDEGGGFLGEPLAANLPTILTKVVARSTFVSGFMWLNVVRQSGSTWVYGATGTVAATNFESEANVLDNCAVMRVSDFKWIIVSCTSFTADILCQRAITGKVVSP